MIFLTLKKHWLVFLFLIFITCFYFKTQTFVTDDLPRHLTNGRLILATHQIPHKNLYSYTFPDYPTIMHHWGSGVIFFLITHFFNFSGLTLFTALICLTAFSLALFALEKPSLNSRLLAALAAFLLIVSRPDPRPEIFSYLFFCLTFFIILRLHSRRLTPRWFYLLPLIQLLWINLHLFFFLGFLIQFIFLFYFWRTHSPLTPHSVKVFLFSFLASLINPFGFTGIIAPISIATHTQGFITENLSIFAFLTHFYEPAYYYFVLVLAFLGVFLLSNRHLLFTSTFSLPLTFLLLFACQGVVMVRTIIFFGYTLLIFAPIFIPYLPRLKLTPIFILLLIGSLLFKPSFFSPFGPNFGLGLQPTALNLGTYLQSHPPKDPILNNFNLGGYLIYFLYPQHSVFIDQRPEAYPSAFINQTYIPLQVSETTWQHLDSAYHFGTIILSIGDAWPEFSQFINYRLTDPNWQVAYQDSSTLVLTRR